MRMSDWSSDVCSSDLKRPERREFLVCVRVIPLDDVQGRHGLARDRLALALPPRRDIEGLTELGRRIVSQRGEDKRSEERRVGKEWGRTCSTRGWRSHKKKKTIHKKTNDQYT